MRFVGFLGVLFYMLVLQNSCSSYYRACVTEDKRGSYADIESESPGCGVVRNDLRNTHFSVGVANNTPRAPNSAPVIPFYFNENPNAGEASVVAVAVPDSTIKIDGQQSSNVEWAGVKSAFFSLRPPLEILTPAQNPNNLVGIDHGINRIEISAAYDSTYIYMRFVWDDITRNDRSAEWTYNGSVWEKRKGTPMSSIDPSAFLGTTAMDESEDRLAVMFNITIADFVGSRGCAGLCHISSAAPIPPGSKNYVFGGTMNTVNPGERADNWVWRATTMNMIGIADDMYFNCGTDDVSAPCNLASRIFPGDEGELGSFLAPRQGSGQTQPCVVPATTLLQADGARFSSLDITPFRHFFGNEWLEVDGSNNCVSQGPSRVPIDFVAGSGGVKYIYERGSRFIGTLGGEAKFYTSASGFAAGDILPGYIGRAIAIGDEDSACARCNVEAEGTWENGRWTVELKRTLRAPQPFYDVEFLSSP